MKTAVKVLNRTVNHFLLVVLVGLALLAGLLVWDSDKFFEEGSAEYFGGYKPTEYSAESFKALQSKNSDVIGWLTLYDTAIDFPVVQHDSDNSHYIKYNATGEPSASGSIFLDVYSNPHFTDFNSLIYGHYMEEHNMFGDLKLFRDTDFFESHEHGSLYYDGAFHGLTILAFLEVSAYDETIYTPHIADELRSSYLVHLLEQAVQLREEPSEEDRLVLLSSCADDISSGRYALLCKVTDTAEGVPDTANNESPRKIPTFLAEWLSGMTGIRWAGLLFTLILATAGLYAWVRKRDA